MRICLTIATSTFERVGDKCSFNPHCVSNIVRFIYDDDRRLSFLKYETVDLILDDLEVIGLAECRLSSELSGKVPVKIIYS